jgi:outer membrane protein OmpA-like peptidoglycan-associated protein
MVVLFLFLKNQKNRIMKMAKRIAIFFFVMLITSVLNVSVGQTIRVPVKKKLINETNERANKNTDEAIDKAFDGIENGIKGLFKKKDKKNNTEKSGVKEQVSLENDLSAESGNSAGNEGVVKPKEEAHHPDLKWSAYDFVPGQTVIFADGPSAVEENGEFPSRWDLVGGGAEIAELDGEPIIVFITDAGNMYYKGIVPYLKDAEQDYLPDVFTVEFDAYYPPNRYNDTYYLTLYDRKNQNRNELPQITFYVNSISCGNTEGTYRGKSRGNRDNVGGWRHFSVAYTRGKLKVYLDDQRLINIPHLKGNPTGITLSSSCDKPYVKNIRIAAGGVKYYDRVLSDGKIVENGIRFDVNKATLKPESMGPINKIYKLMTKYPDINFSVEGHTDSDGDAGFNQKLSEERAKVVMDKLIAMGIDKNRLRSKGWGETKPIDTNSTAEGKANNRRVEFIKF